MKYFAMYLINKYICIKSYLKMGEKQQLTFKIDSDVISEFDKILSEYKEVTGIKPVRQDSIETAMKDYIAKTRKQIELFKTKKTGE